MPERIKVEGLREFQAALRAMDSGLPKRLRLVLNDAVGEVIDYAHPRMPSRTGAARGSLKARSSQRQARIAMGGRRAPYAPWLDFGGQGKRKGRPPRREFIKDGRYVYQGLKVRRAEITEIMSRGLTELASSAGLEVT